MSPILSDDEDSLGNFSSSPSSLSSETFPLEHLPFNETKTCTISTSASTPIISKGYEDQDKNIDIKDEKDRGGHLVKNKNRYFRVPNGRYSGRIGQIRLPNKKGDYTIHIIALPGEISVRTMFSGKCIAQHRGDVLKLSAEERGAIQKLENSPRKKRRRSIKGINGAKNNEHIDGRFTSAGFESDSDSFCLDSDDENLMAVMPDGKIDMGVKKKVQNTEILSMINDDRSSFRYIRVPNGQYSGRVGEIRSPNKRGDYTIRIVTLPEETSFQTTLSSKFIAQHRDDTLDTLELSIEEREAIQKLENHPRKRRRHISKETDGAMITEDRGRLCTPAVHSSLLGDSRENAKEIYNVEEEKEAAQHTYLPASCHIKRANQKRIESDCDSESLCLDSDDEHLSLVSTSSGYRIVSSSSAMPDKMCNIVTEETNI